MLNPPGPGTWYCVAVDLDCSEDDLLKVSLQSTGVIQEKVATHGIKVKWEYGMYWDLFLHLSWDGPKEDLVPLVNKCLVDTPYKILGVIGESQNEKDER